MIEEARERSSIHGLALEFASGQPHLPKVRAKSLQELLQLPGGLCVARTFSSSGLSGMPCPGKGGVGLPVASPGENRGEEVAPRAGSGPSVLSDVQNPKNQKWHLGLPPSFGISGLLPL